MFLIFLRCCVLIFKTNFIIICGFACGLYLSNLNFQLTKIKTLKSCRFLSNFTENLSIVDNRLLPKIRNEGQILIGNRISLDGEQTKLLSRPRFYSSELGINQNILIGILLSSKNINLDKVLDTIQIFNETLSRLSNDGMSFNRLIFFLPTSNQLKYFSRQHGSSMLSLVGFSERKDRNRPFNVLKYVYDSFVNDFNYFYFSTDRTFLNIFQLKKFLRQISSGHEFLYVGKKVVGDSSFCSLDAGIVLNNALLRKLNDNINWCVQNAIYTEEYGENIGRCVSFSAGIECSDSVNSKVFGYKNQYLSIKNYFKKTSKRYELLNAVTIYPVLELDDFYVLNNFILKEQVDEYSNDLNHILKLIRRNRKKYQQRENWPYSAHSESQFTNRFDIKAFQYFNMRDIFSSNEIDVVKRLSKEQLIAIKRILEDIRLYNQSNHLVFNNLTDGYVKMDFRRGIDYVMNVEFLNLRNREKLFKRFNICKPLSKTEFITNVPYVTENSIISILMPVYETEVATLNKFLKNHLKFKSRYNQKHDLVIVFIKVLTSNIDTSDFYLAKKLINDYNAVNSSYGNSFNLNWYAINMPKFMIDNVPKSALNIVVIDLILRKIGANSLILVLNPYMEFDNRTQFLNKVKMNTIQKFQIFSPIPYTYYTSNKMDDQVKDDYKIDKVNDDVIDARKGHFDRSNLEYLSFYAYDYILIRKRMHFVFPITRNENEIQSNLQKLRSNCNLFCNQTLLEYFIKFSFNLHVIRAPEPNLKVMKWIKSNRSSRFFGSKSQIGQFLLKKHFFHN